MCAKVRTQCFNLGPQKVWKPNSVAGYPKYTAVGLTTVFKCCVKCISAEEMIQGKMQLQ